MLFRDFLLRQESGVHFPQDISFLLKCFGTVFAAGTRHQVAAAESRQTEATPGANNRGVRRTPETETAEIKAGRSYDAPDLLCAGHAICRLTATATQDLQRLRDRRLKKTNLGGYVGRRGGSRRERERLWGGGCEE